MKASEGTMDITTRAHETLLLYRMMQRAKNIRDYQSAEQLQGLLMVARRNYAISRKLGKQWEYHIHQEFKTRVDTKIEFVRHSYGWLRVALPFKAKAFDITELDNPVVRVEKIETIDIELKRWRYDKQDRLLAFSPRMNTLYVGID